MADERAANQLIERRQERTNQVLHHLRTHTHMQTHTRTHALVLVQGLLVRGPQVRFYGNGEAPGLILPRLDDLVDNEAGR